MTEVEHAKSGIAAPVPDLDRNILVNQLFAELEAARRRPDLYPPNPGQNPTGAVMTPCNRELGRVDDLSTLAHDHAWYRCDNPGAPAHEYPPGQDIRVTIAGLGYTWPAEIYSGGLSDPVAVVKDWMQNDAKWGWKHRNIILTCLPGEKAGGGVGLCDNGYYRWYVDFGLKP